MSQHHATYVVGALAVLACHSHPIFGGSELEFVEPRENISRGPAQNHTSHYNPTPKKRHHKRRT